MLVKESNFALYDCKVILCSEILIMNNGVKLTYLNRNIADECDGVINVWLINQVFELNECTMIF